MNLHELETYRLSDAIKFNETLNPLIWGSNEKMRPEVREKLLAIADDFREFLGITDLEIKDITVSGSNAAFTYTPHSDIDLHLVTDLPKADISEVYRELFNAKKYQYNDQHDYKIGPYDVELYVQNANEPHHSQGIYSLTNDDWVKVPVRRKTNVDDISVKSKYEDIGNRIDQAIKSNDRKKMDAISLKVKDMRQSGLDTTGEFGPENLAFKVLRGNGTLDRLRKARMDAKDREMSLRETDKNKPKKIYGFKNYRFPGFDYFSSLSQNVDQPSEIDEDTAEFKPTSDATKIVRFEDGREIPLQKAMDDFVAFCAKHLHLKKLPEIRLRGDSDFGTEQRTMGHYVDTNRMIEVETSGRHILDIFRTLAHELTHALQHQRAPMPKTAGDTGSPWEDEAHATGGVLMRYFDRAHPEYFKAEIVEPNVDEGLKDKLAAGALAACVAGAPGCATTQGQPSAADVLRGVQTAGRTVQSVKQMGRAGAEEELIQRLKNELRRQRGQLPESSLNEATGYIPVNDKEAKDPRYSMAITCDIKPGEVQRQARKMGFTTDAAGIPPTLKTSGKIQ